MPLILALIVLFFLAGWRATTYDSATAGAETLPSPATVAPPNPPSPVIDASQSEISGLRQEVADLDTQVKHQTLVSMAANDKVQTLQSELMDAQKKILAASTDREDAVRKISDLRTELQENVKDLNEVCRVLRGGNGEPRGHVPAGALAACHATVLK
ncbi:MAG: hypothetical protein WA734_01300 [Candidatus Acidiferrales bacterium]